MYKLSQTISHNYGVELFYRTPELCERRIMISRIILKKIISAKGNFCCNVVALITFRDKFGKKSISDSFDDKVIAFIESADLNQKYLENLANMDKIDLGKLL